MTTIENKIGARIVVPLRLKRSGIVNSIAVTMAKGFCFGLLVAIICLNYVDAAVADVSSPRRADFGREPASHDARHIADWVVDSADNRGMPFAIVDKTNAKVFVFDAAGQLQGAASALLGQAQGDVSIPGIGDKKLSSIPPEERTTPAGRFVAELGRNIHGVEVLWVDYDGAVSMHPVITSNPREHRLQRLASPTTLDKRITYGCINVAADFFNNVVRKTFSRSDGIVYVLPETSPARDLFGSYDVGEGARR
jgi:hypothetical protein